MYCLFEFVCVWVILRLEILVGYGRFVVCFKVEKCIILCVVNF